MVVGFVPSSLSEWNQTEKDIDTQLTKAWTDLNDKMKRSYSQAAVIRYCYIDALRGR